MDAIVLWLPDDQAQSLEFSSVRSSGSLGFDQLEFGLRDDAPGGGRSGAQSNLNGFLGIQD